MPSWGKIRFAVVVIFATIGFPSLWKSKPTPETLLIGILSAVSLYLIKEFLSKLLGRNVNAVEKLFDDFGELEFLNPLNWIFEDIVIPFIEELAYRRTLQQLLGFFVGFPGAIFLQAVVFASPLGHPGRCKNNRTELTKRLFLIIAGVVFGVIANRFTIWDSIAAHAVFNIGVDILSCLLFFNQRGELRFVRLEEAIRKGSIRVDSKVWAEGLGWIVEAQVTEVGDNKKYIVARDSRGREWTFGRFTPHIIIQIS